MGDWENHAAAGRISLAMPVLLLAGVVAWGLVHGTLRASEQEAIDHAFAEIVRRF